MKNFIEDKELLDSSNIRDYDIKQVIASEGDTGVGLYVYSKGGLASSNMINKLQSLTNMVLYLEN